MLVRAFRITDKFSNAGLKLIIYLTNGLLEQVTILKESVVTLFAIVVLGIAAVGGAITNRAFRASRQASKKAVRAYQATDERRRAMAQRAAVVSSRQAEGKVVPEAKATVVEDPLIGQNRMLSVFTVFLLVALIAIVLWSTSRSDDGNVLGGGSLPQNPVDPTFERLPTPVPTTIPEVVPQSTWQGTLVFSLREAGQEDLFALQRGDSQPRRLTNDPADDRDPAWGPDGRTLAFTSKRDGSWAIYLMDVVTKQLQRITFSPHYVGAPTWSPDGTFLAYEAYNPQSGNLDIFIIAVDRSQGPIPLTYNPGPDFEPAWAPDADGTGGRQIAYTSIRDGRQDIFVINLDDPNESAAFNLTKTADIHENHATWSPDGRQVAYTATVNGVESVYVRRIDDSDQELVVGRGAMPVWGASSVLYVQPLSSVRTAISGGLPNTFGSTTTQTLVSGIASDLDWTVGEPTISAVIANYPPILPAANITPDRNGLFSLAVLQGVDAPEPYLNALVYPSFDALRFAALEKLGFDFLANLEDAFWGLTRTPEIGQSRDSWHYTGRAFAFERDLVFEGNPPRIVVVRDDREIGTYWRVFVRVADQAQTGILGEPLRVIPWDFGARTSGNADAFEQGGQPMQTIPDGYYVDFTQLAADYGWYPIPSGRTWRQNFSAVLFWTFVNSSDLEWREAMRQLYTEDELNRFLNNEPVSPPSLLPTLDQATETPAQTPTRTATPRPPDQ